MGQEVPAKHNAINIKAKNRANRRKRQTWKFLFSSGMYDKHCEALEKKIK